MTRYLRYCAVNTVGAAVLAMVCAAPTLARVDGDTITLGSAISFTGK